MIISHILIQIIVKIKVSRNTQTIDLVLFNDTISTAKLI